MYNGYNGYNGYHPGFDYAGWWAAAQMTGSDPYFQYLSENIKDKAQQKAFSALFQLIGGMNFTSSDIRRRIMLLPRLGQPGTNNFLQYSLPSEFQYDGEVLVGPELYQEFVSHQDNRKKAGAQRAKDHPYAPAAKRARMAPPPPPAQEYRREYHRPSGPKTAGKKPAGKKYSAKQPFPKGPPNQRGASSRHAFKFINTLIVGGRWFPALGRGLPKTAGFCP